ncbi:MAG: amidase [Chloroflexota bacterium]|jgi:aspartyl-tRNA(Asn)/glutamyl-tRNA(Gln) amidotransferase subunit A
MTSRDLCYLTLDEQARLIRTGEVSPMEVLESALRQIERVDRKVNGFITVTADEARTVAREAESEITRGGYRGPLHGIPVALKDLFYTKGIRTTAGSRFLKDFVPNEDAEVVARLKKAGALLVGKTQMHEFAYGPTSTNPHYGDARNPWDLDRLTGGSSGGSAAAVATSMAAAALGSDTGGSIRIPASLCGVTGIKPTYGRVSKHGTVALSWCLDHVGPLCKTAMDAALVLGAIAGWDPKDPTSSREPVPDYAAQLSQGISGLKLGVLREYATDPMDPEVVSAFQSATETLRQLGANVDEVSVPEVQYAVAASTAILSAEAAAYHEERLRTQPEWFGPDVRARLEGGLFVAATDYVQAQRVRRLLIDRFRKLLQRYDALLCPTEPAAAPRIDQETVQFDGVEEPRVATLTRHTRLFNMTGFPTASVPCGFTSNGMPVGLQIAGAPFAEGMVLRIGHAYQQATEWHLRVPPVAAM